MRDDAVLLPLSRGLGRPVSALVSLVTLTLNLGRIIARGVDNLPTNYGLPRTFRSRLISQHLSDASRDLATLTFKVTVLVADVGPRAASVYQI